MIGEEISVPFDEQGHHLLNGGGLGFRNFVQLSQAKFVDSLKYGGNFGDNIFLIRRERRRVIMKPSHFQTLSEIFGRINEYLPPLPYTFRKSVFLYYCECELDLSKVEKYSIAKTLTEFLSFHPEYLDEISLSIDTALSQGRIR